MQGVVAIDIETLGRLEEIPLPSITCICLFDGIHKHTFRFYWPGSTNINNNKNETVKTNDSNHESLGSPDKIDKNINTVIAILDQAKFIAGFNAVLFDLEFIRRHFPELISEEKMSQWVAKCVDPFMCTKYILKQTCSLNDLLLLNGLESKSGSGKDAIILALDGKWNELSEYCMMDTVLTYQLCTLKNIQFSPSLSGTPWNDHDATWRFHF